MYEDQVTFVRYAAVQVELQPCTSVMTRHVTACLSPSATMLPMTPTCRSYYTPSWTPRALGPAAWTDILYREKPKGGSLTVPITGCSSRWSLSSWSQGGSLYDGGRGLARS